MLTRSYVAGDKLSAADVETFGVIGLPDAAKYPNAYRWYIHVAALIGAKILPLVAGGGGGNFAELDATMASKSHPGGAGSLDARRGELTHCFVASGGEQLLHYFSTRAEAATAGRKRSL